MKKLLVLLCLILASWSVRAQQDSVRVSLLTCAPGTEIYELFGHTAIRYENPAEGKDLVFNYGIFSFNTPNFVLRFVKVIIGWEWCLILILKENMPCAALRSISKH